MDKTDVKFWSWTILSFLIGAAVVFSLPPGWTGLNIAGLSGLIGLGSGIIWSKWLDRD